MDIWNHTSLSDFVLLGLFSYSPYDFFLFSLVLLASATALASNILFLLLTQADRRLHTPMYFFLSQLSIMDLTIMGAVVPKMAANFLSGSKFISWGGCATQIFLVVMVGGAECFLLAVMAYDRYVAVCHPLWYPVLMNWKACCLMSLASWMGGVADSVIDFFLRLKAMDVWNNTSLSDFILLGLFSYSPYDFFLFTLVLLASAASLTGNILFLLLIQADRCLHTPMYFFLSQVSIMDLTMMGTVVPKMAANFLSGSKFISRGGCATQVFLVVMVGSAECFLLAVMAYDRYVAVCLPLRYPMLMNWKACCVMALA
ncbi:hypothetical protein K5549_016075, partial [Capra hircus]